MTSETLLNITPDSLSHRHMLELSARDYDQLAFGVIELDGEFIVRTYNTSESTIARGRRRVRIRALRGTDTCRVFVTPLPSLDDQ